MDSQPELELMIKVRGRNLPVQQHIDPFGSVVASVVADLEAAGFVIEVTAQDPQLAGVAAWIREDRADAHTRHRLKLVPVAKEIVAVGGCRHEHRAGGLDEVSELELLVIRVDPIFLRAGIAAQRCLVEIRLGQTQIGLVAELLGHTKFQLHEVVDPRVARAVVA